MDPVVIEVAVNGVTRKERNPAAPISPEEVAEDTIRCFDAGATVVHTHPHSFGDGSSPAVTAEKYASAYRTVVAERPEGIIYPTMSGGPTIADRWDHHRLLAAEGLIRCGCLDPGSTNLSSFGADGLPTATDFVYANSPNDIRYMMSACDDEGLGPSFAIYEPAFLRMVLGYYQSGKLPAGSLVKFYFSGDSGYLAPGWPTFSAPPIPEALALYRAMLGDADLPWAVTVLGGDITDTPVASLALEQGGHIRVGIEDFADAESNVGVRAARRRPRREGGPLGRDARRSRRDPATPGARQPVARRLRCARVARLADRHPGKRRRRLVRRHPLHRLRRVPAPHARPDRRARGRKIRGEPAARQTAVEELEMWRAALACPTRSIGTVDRRAEPPDVFPWEVTPGVWLCGRNDRRSFGAHSWFVPEVGGGFLVDSPHWSADVVDAIDAHGGIAHVLLTHQDDVADAEKFADHFEARVWIHEADRPRRPVRHRRDHRDRRSDDRRRSRGVPGSGPHRRQRALPERRAAPLHRRHDRVVPSRG